MDELTLNSPPSRPSSMSTPEVSFLTRTAQYTHTLHSVETFRKLTGRREVAQFPTDSILSHYGYRCETLLDE